jgi:hypothetical protein
MTPSLSLSFLILSFRTISAFSASGDSVFSVTAISFAPFFLQTSIIGSSSAVLPPRETMTRQSSRLSAPRPPWTASAGGMNMAPLSMQHSEWANFFAAIPEEPDAQVMIRVHDASASTARPKVSRSMPSRTVPTASFSVSTDFIAAS